LKIGKDGADQFSISATGKKQKDRFDMTFGIDVDTGEVGIVMTVRIDLVAFRREVINIESDEEAGGNLAVDKLKEILAENRPGGTTR
jgi:hypothetical protein